MSTLDLYIIKVSCEIITERIEEFMSGLEVLTKPAEYTINEPKYYEVLLDYAICRIKLAPIEM